MKRHHWILGIGVLLSIVTIAIGVMNDKFKEMIEPTISTLNILIVIFIFTRDEYIKAKEVKEEKKSYWINNLSIEKYIQIINEFFLKNENILLEANNKPQEYIKESMKQFQEGRRKIEHYILDIVSVVDIKKYEELIKLLQDKYEDEFSKGLQEILCMPSGRRTMKIKKLIREGHLKKTELLKKLYELE